MSSDYQLEDTLYLPFTTRAFATGIPTALVSGAVDIYEDVTATPIITGETLAVSLNSVAGFNMITVTATSGTGFGAGQSYTAILQAGTVDSVSVVGEVVAHFTLDMSAAAKDLANGTDGLGAIKAETALIVEDTGTTIPALLPAALVGGRMDANTSAIAGVQASATNLEASTDTILSGTASGTPTTTAMISDIGITVDDQFKGKAIIFASDTTTAALRNQATSIAACTASSNTLTFTALTTAPVSGDTFVIV